MKIGEVLVLDSNESYMVSSCKVLNGINYVYLMNINDYSDFMFCKCISNDGLERVVDEDTVKELIVLFNEDFLDNN